MAQRFGVKAMKTAWTPYGYGVDEPRDRWGILSRSID
jgi:hypothetical protein